jgi:hypothetical protein
MMEDVKGAEKKAGQKTGLVNVGCPKLWNIQIFTSRHIHAYFTYGHPILAVQVRFRPAQYSVIPQ